MPDNRKTGERNVYTNDQIPRELEHYVERARRMRAEYLAGLLRKGLVALSRAVRKAARRETRAESSAKHTFAER
jgi:hypothetical protein